jgi:hypothetical protein
MKYLNFANVHFRDKTDIGLGARVAFWGCQGDKGCSLFRNLAYSPGVMRCDLGSSGLLAHLPKSPFSPEGFSQSAGTYGTLGGRSLERGSTCSQPRVPYLIQICMSYLYHLCFWNVS